MPRICVFRGIVISMYRNEGAHQVGHFHARYAEHKASVGFDGTVLAGWLPAAQLRLVRDWAEARRAALDSNWERARRRESILDIDPLP